MEYIFSFWYWYEFQFVVWILISYCNFDIYLKGWDYFFKTHLHITLSYRYIYLTHHFSHYGDVIMSMMASQITSLTIVYSTIYSGVDQTKHQSSESLAFVRGIHQWPVNSLHKGPVMRKRFPFDVVIMCIEFLAETELDVYTMYNHFWLCYGRYSLAIAFWLHISVVKITFMVDKTDYNKVIIWKSHQTCVVVLHMRIKLQHSHG